MRTYPSIILVNGNMAGNLTSSIWQLQYMYGASASCVVSAGSTAVGTLSLQGSVDGIDFTTLGAPVSPATLAVTSGGNTYIFDVTQTSVQYLRITYTATSGAGTLNIDTYNKGL